MENIKILSEEKVVTLSTNQKYVQEQIVNNKDNQWLKEFFKEEDPFIKSKLIVKEFELKTDYEEADESDFENAKILFENIKINESQASDYRLWIGLTFGKFYNYMKYRYPAEKSTNIANKWFLQKKIGSSKAQMFRQGLSMLWWYAYITYDENNKENPFELTEFAFKHKDFIISLYSRNFCNSKSIRLALLKALKDFEKNGGNISPKTIYNGVIKYASFLGGAYLLDTFSEAELYERFYNKLIQLFVEENLAQTTFKL